MRPKVIQEELCPCGRMFKGMSWLCTLCYVQKEIGYALSELTRGGVASGYEDLGTTWHELGLARLQKLTELHLVDEQR